MWATISLSPSSLLLGGSLPTSSALLPLLPLTPGAMVPAAVGAVLREREVTVGAGGWKDPGS